MRRNSLMVSMAPVYEVAVIPDSIRDPWWCAEVSAAEAWIAGRARNDNSGRSTAPRDWRWQPSPRSRSALPTTRPAAGSSNKTRTPARRCGPAAASAAVMAGSRRVQSARSMATFLAVEVGQHVGVGRACVFLLYWQVTHQAAVKSTNTGWPAASSWSTRPGSQGCQAPASARRDCCGGGLRDVRRRARPGQQRQARRSRPPRSPARVRPRRVRAQTTMLSATSSASRAPAPSMPLCWPSTQTSQATVANIGKAMQPAEGVHPRAGPRQQARDRRHQAGRQIGQRHAEADARRTSAAPGPRAGRSRNRATRP